jgi:hypothetical protein
MVNIKFLGVPFLVLCQTWLVTGQAKIKIMELGDSITGSPVGSQ